MKLKNVEIKKTGNGYHIMIPPTLVRDTEILQIGKKYELNFSEMSFFRFYHVT